MDQVWIAVIGEDHGAVGGEEDVELPVAEAVGVVLGVLQLHQVHHVHYADLQVGNVLAQQVHRRQGLDGGDVAAAGHDHVRLGALVGARPSPDADARVAVLDRRVHVQPLGLGLLARDDDVDVVAAAQAVVRDREQRVGVGREVHPDDIGLLVDHVVDEARVLVAEAVVVLAPHVGGEQVVEGGDGAPPGNVAAGGLEPLGVLVEHGIHHVHKCLVGGEDAVPPGEQVAFEPALAGVLAQDLHDPAVGGQAVVLGEGVRHPYAVGDLEDRAETVGRGLVRSEHAEVSALEVAPHDVPQEPPHDAGALAHGPAGPRHIQGIVAEVRHPEVLEQESAVGMGVGPHAPRPVGGQRRQLRHEPSGLVEELLRVVALHPFLQQPQVIRLGRQLRQGHLVGAPGALGLEPVHFLGTGPALGGAQDDHGPARTGGDAGAARPLLDRADPGRDRVQGLGHEPVHLGGFRAFDEVRLVTVAHEQALQFVAADAREDRRIRDLVPVQMEDGQHRAVQRGIEELVGMPGRRQRAGLGLAVAHDASDDQVRVVKRRAVGVGDRVAQLASLVDGARSLGGHVAGDPAGKRELLEQQPHSRLVPGHVGIDLAVGPLQVGVGHEPGPAVAGAGNVDDVEVLLANDPVQVRVDEVQPGGGAPVPKEPRLDVGGGERLLEQGVVEQIDLPDGQVVGGAPVGVDRLQHCFGKRAGHGLQQALAAEAALPLLDDLLVVHVIGHLAAQGGQDRASGPDHAGVEAAALVGGDHVGRHDHFVAELP